MTPDRRSSGERGDSTTRGHAPSPVIRRVGSAVCLVGAALFAVGCGKPDSAPGATATPPAASLGAARSASTGTAPARGESPPVATSAAKAASAAPGAGQAPPLADAEVGALFASISEKGGHFPSDNFVSNESSLLHVDAAVHDPRRRGGAYLGVGPDQNFTYIGRLAPSVAFVVDIRRENALLHLVYKVLFETSTSRAAFLTRLFSRDGGEATETLGPEATVEELLALVEKAKPNARSEAALVTATLTRQRELAIPVELGDEKAIREAVHAFASEGPAIRYKMEGSSRKYPTLFDLAKEKTDAGARVSFLADESTFRTVQRIQRENRLIPVVGNLAGDKAVRGIGEALRKRGVDLSAVYTSNVEQYVFAPADWKAWRANLASLPAREDALLLRVYFDQGKHHPHERAGYRTVSLAHDLHRFLERAEKPGYKTWFEVASDDALLTR